MLVLTRKPHEQIEIGEQRIRVTVLEVRGNRVRLGIEAPPEVSIQRREVVLEMSDDDSRLLGAFV
jgi:carbon storage regulator